MRTPTLVKTATLPIIASLGLILGLPVVSQAASAMTAALCDENYNLQTATQYIFTSQSVADLGEPTVTELKTDLSDMKTFIDSPELQFMVGFEGACGTYTAKPLTFLIRQKADRAFKKGVVNGYSVRLYDTNSLLTGHDYGYWFGFTTQPDIPSFAVGKPKSNEGLFTTWYGLSVVVDSTKNATSGLWSGRRTSQGAFPTPDDSSHMVDAIKNTRKTLTFDDLHQGSLTVQLLRITYDSKPTAIGARNGRSQPNPGERHFSVRQSGSQMHLSLNQATVNHSGTATSPTIQLYDMLGHGIAQLRGEDHGSNPNYTWNGKTHSGSTAPSGVYFVEAAGKVLGRFMYQGGR
jgi:hypothetical protein